MILNLLLETRLQMRITEGIALRSKLYALYLEDLENPGNFHSEKKLKGVSKRYVKKNLKFAHYKKCLLDGKNTYAEFRRIGCKNFQVYTIRTKKKALSAFDDKVLTKIINS